MLSRVLFFLLILHAFVHGQQMPTATDSAKEAVITEQMDSRSAFEADGTGTREWTVAIKVLSDAGVKELAVLAYSYSSASETLEIPYVRVRKPDGSVVNTPDYNIQDMPADVTRSAPLYSDVHEKHVAVKGLAVGDTLEYQLLYRINKPDVPNHFWFEESFSKAAIVKNEVVEISFPSSKQVTVYSPRYKPEFKEESGRRIYTWHYANLARSGDESDDDETDEEASIQVSTFTSWEQIGQWYASLQQDAIKPTPTISAKAAELTRGLTNQRDKIRALYNFVSLNVHYVGLDFGIGRYQPHNAQDVLENAYGDCKDKHTLLASLLKAAGIDAWPVLIHSSRKLVRDVPSIAQFDHVITAVPLEGDILWLDTTPEVAPMGLLLVNLRDKDALLVSEGRPPALIKTPAQPPFAQEQKIVVTGKLSDEGVYTGHFEDSFRGDTEVVLRSAYRSVSESQWNELTQRIAAMSGYAGEVSKTQVSSPADTTQPFRISYDYVRKDYGDWPNKQIISPLPPTGIESMGYLRKHPKMPYLLGQVGEFNFSSVMHIPPNYSVDLPKDVDLVEGFVEYHSKLEMKGDALHTTRRFVIRKSKLELADWAAFAKFAKAVNEDEYRFLSLSGENTGASANAVHRDELNQKFRDGTEALSQRDATRAQELFSQIVAADPKYHGANYNLAVAELQQNKVEDAIRAFHKEEEVTADDEKSYQAAARLEMFMGRRDEALADWKKLIRADPKNRDAPLQASELLMQDGKNSEAVEVLEAALKSNPDSPNLQAELGTAYVLAGKPDAGSPMLQKAAISAESLATMTIDLLTRVATSLADAHVHLDIAEAYAKEAVRQAEDSAVASVEAETVLPNTLLNLAQSWDTMGWVELQSGQLPRAEGHIRAAWSLAQADAAGYHLGQLLEKQGKTKEAIHAYLLAITATDLNPIIQIPGAPKPSRASHDQALARYTKLTGKPPSNAIDRLSNGKWPETPSDELTHMREVKFGPVQGASGSAEFAIVFTPAGLESTKFVSGDSALHGQADRIAKAKYGVLFPDGSKAKIARRLILSCHAAEGCNGMFMQPQMFSTPK